MVTTQDPGGRSAASWALHQILDLIRGGSPGPGERLPAERDLAVRLGVSRGSVREAISALVTLGVLESRHGAGVFVTSLEPVALLPSLTDTFGLIADRHPTDVARLHSQVEGAVAARAAAHADPEALGLLAGALADMRLAASEPAPRGQHDRFRHTIARLSDDRFHRAVAAVAQDPVAEGMIVLLRASRTAADPGAERDLTLHEALVGAIADRDPDAARALAQQLVAVEFPVLPGPVPVRTPVEPVTKGAPVLDQPLPAWFGDAKFGLIVHWGPYSVPGWAATADAGSPGAEDSPAPHFAEWYQAAIAEQGSAAMAHHERVHGGRPYREFAAPFAAAVAGWSPEEWAADFARWGARYVVQVAKHHDGYLLWPTRVRHPRQQGWHTTRDVVGELATAVRDHGMRFGVFYSSGADWSFAPVTQAAEVASGRPQGADYARYVEAHWRELIEAYRPDGLWNDTGYPAAGDARRVITEYHSHVPDGVVTERFRMSATGLSRVAPPGSPWESVRPVGLSFGWNRAETTEHVLSGPALVATLLDVVARNGNLLLGVSPDDHGHIPDLQRRSLDELGAWLARHGDAIYGTRPWGPGTTTTTDGRSVWCTQGPQGRYLCVEPGGTVTIEGLEPPIGPVTRLVDGAPVTVHPGPRDGCVLELPPDDDGPVTVLRIAPTP